MNFNSISIFSKYKRTVPSFLPTTSAIATSGHSSIIKLDVFIFGYFANSTKVRCQVAALQLKNGQTAIALFGQGK
jgi:hypothetical protein